MGIDVFRESWYILLRTAEVAQLVEQRIRNA